MQVSSCLASTRPRLSYNLNVSLSTPGETAPHADLCGLRRIFDELHRGPDLDLPPHLQHTLDRRQVQEASRPRPTDSPPAAKQRDIYEKRYDYIEQQRTMANTIAARGDGPGCFNGTPTHTETLPDGSRRVMLNHTNGEVTTINVDPCHPNWTRYTHDGARGRFTITRDGTRLIDQGPHRSTTYDGLPDGRLVRVDTGPCGRETYTTVQTDGAVWQDMGQGERHFFPPRTSGFPYLGTER